MTAVSLYSALAKNIFLFDDPLTVPKLADKLSKELKISEPPIDWWASEKWDGIRALWDGEKIISRGSGVGKPKVYTYIPEWFKLTLPPGIALDGEIWIGRGFFQKTSRLSTLKPGKSYNSHAYILSASGVTKILDNKFNENIIPVDEYLICNYQKHERNDLHFFNNDMNVYAPYVDKSIVKQTSKGSVEGPKIPANLNHKKLLYSFYDDPTKWAEKFISYPARTLEFDLILDEPFENCFSMPLFTREFCEYMIEEAEEANVWSTDRHEYFPTTDFLLKDIQFDKIYYQVLKQFVFPALINAYSLDGKGWSEMESEDFW